MSKKLRFFILFFGTLLFIITAPILIAYSIGYRYDFENKRVVKKGVLVLWAENSDVEILINDEKIENTETKSSGLINKYLNSKGSLFEIELLPGSYTIKLQKEGYVAWEKRLNIKSGYATIADGIHLFPENPEIKKIGGENIQIASFAEDGKKAYWIEEDSSLTVFDFSKKKVETALSQKDIKGLTLDKNFLFVSKDSKSILFKALDSKRNTHFLILDISLKKPKVHNITSELAKMTISDLSSENFTWHPKDSKKLLVLHKENVYEIDILEEDKTPKLLLDNILTLTSNKDKIYFIQKDNTQNPKPILQQAIFSYDLKNIRIRKILELPKGKYIKIIPSSNSKYLLLDKEGNLFLVNSNNLEQIADNVKNACWSESNNKILIKKKYELWIYDVKPEKDERNLNLLTRYSSEVYNAFFLPTTKYDYAVFQVGNKIKAVECDYRYKANASDLVILNQNKKTYITSSSDGNFLYFVGIGKKKQKVLYEVNIE
ncbi:hypothetical protein COY23_01855 [bacterium (Candidatus Torokbacteria) CG_4_10_14_0_2_um_filter_35_8]|nr:MAG: hypothetical protein COY23_01855 [bacterium (Candidatus Torokbacteria) CG_4_10_14_0_2_um_filter_35_8]